MACGVRTRLADVSNHDDPMKVRCESVSFLSVDVGPGEVAHCDHA